MTNEEVLNTFANKMLTAVEGIEAFGKEQIPDYIEQVLMYNFWESTIIATVLASLILVFLVVFILGILKSNKTGWGVECPSPSAFTVIGSGFILIFLIPIGLADGIVPNAKEALKIHLAPKVYIVDYLRKEIK